MAPLLYTTQNAVSIKIKDNERERSLDHQNQI